MQHILWLSACVLLSLWATASEGQLYPSQPPLLGELKKDCYGPGVSCDGTGRAFHWKPEGTQDGPNPILEPEINKYGYGSSSDQFGRRIEPHFDQELRPRQGAGRYRGWRDRLEDDR